MESVFQDLRFAFRTLRKARGFTAISLVVLALAIGANTAIFSVINAVLLRPEPYGHPDRLVAPAARFKSLSGPTTAVPFKDYLIWKEQKEVFEDVALEKSAFSDLSSDLLAPERVNASRVTEDFFTTLEAAPVLGRVFAPTDHLRNAEDVVVLSERIWKRKLGGDPGIIGRKVKVRGVDHVVIGVVSSAADFPVGTDLWLPADTAAGAQENVDNFEWRGIARLAPGANLASANAFVSSVGQRMSRDFAANRGDVSMLVLSLSDAIVGTQVKQALWILFAAVTFVLLIAAANLANLSLNRAIARSREFSVRAALGASPRRLIQQVFVESIVLSLAGAALGIALSTFATDLIARFGPQDIPRLDQTHVDVRVLAFSLITAVGTAVVFALVPAVHSSQQSALEGLQQGSRASAGSRHASYRDSLAVSEIALSLALLVAAGLTIKSFSQLQAVDPGVHTANRLTFEITLPYLNYNSPEKLADFMTQFRGKLESIAGVESVGATSALPAGGGGFYLGRTIIEEGKPKPPTGTEYPVMWSAATPGLVDAAGLSLLAGRDFVDADDNNSEPVIVVSRFAAKRMFGNSNPIGKYVRSWRDDNKPRRVVGVVNDVKLQSLDEQAQGQVYVPYAQAPFGIMAFVLRTNGTPTAYLPIVRQQLDSLDPRIAVAKPSTMVEIRKVALAQPRFNTLLISTFSLLAFVLAVVGLFGVLAYSVSQRTREIGIRVALGAQRSDIIGMVMGKGFKLTTLGLAIGMVLSLVASRILKGMLYNVRTVDPAVYVALCLALAVAGALASYLPARNASSITPLEALRYE
jgi:putative ABC transport system permease protein